MPTRTLPSHRRAFGRLQRPGVYETTVTHPRAFRRYLLEQLTPLVAEYGARIEVAVSDQEIPYPYVLERADEMAGGGVTAAELARHFPTPQLSAVGDEIADGQWELREGQPRPLSLFDAARVDYSLRRLVHYTGSDWRNVQQWILLTNYHRYVDQFVRWGREQLGGDGPFNALGAARQRRDRARHSAEEADALVAGCHGTATRCRPITWSRRRARASPSSTSASARPTPRTSPTIWPCCGRTAG